MNERTAGTSTFEHQRSLDGLRALAVIAVVTYHESSAKWARGGFLGVDVFFVLSGFLITSLLVLEHRRTKRISYPSFIGRRLRRLLPALLVMLLGVAAYAWLMVPAGQRDAYREGGLATLFYVKNWQEIYGTSAGFFPLSHTWSLSIEEQWYLVWPLAMGALLALIGRHVHRLALVAVGLALASAALMAALYEPGHTARAYFGTDTRALALLLGAGLGVFLLDRGPPTRAATRQVLEVAGIVGFGALVWMIASPPSENTMYHGGFLLAAAFASIVIAAAVQPHSPVMRPVMSWKPLVALGLISYAVYLFHVPLYFWISPDVVGSNGAFLFAVRVAATLVLAIASYYLLEMPIRRGRWSSRATFATAALASAIVAVVLLLTTV